MAITLTARTLQSHIVFDDQGRPWVEGTGRKVVEIAIDSRAGLSADQIHQAHPDIPLAKVYAAMAYYLDHQVELDAEIARIESYVDDATAKCVQTLTRETLEARLKAKGRLP